MAEVILRHEGATCRSAEHEDVDPADMVADEERVRPDRLAGDIDSGADDPAGGLEESLRPARAAGEQLRTEMEGQAGEEQEGQPGDA